MNKNITFSKRVRIKDKFKIVSCKNGKSYSIFATYTPDYYVMKKDKGEWLLLFSQDGQHFKELLPGWPRSKC